MRLHLPRHRGRRRSGRFIVWPLLLFAIYAGWYWFSNQETVPVTGRTQLVGMDPQQEMALGLQSYRQILSQSQIVPDGEAVDAIREIGRRIAAVADDPGYEWEFNLIQSEQVNAFALPGGKVAVNSGLLPVAQNTDGLAVVMAHEIAHAIARHGAERMAYQQLAQVGQLAVGMSVSEMDTSTQMAVLGAFGLGAQYGFILPYSREHESEADYIGLLYMARACYDPREAPRLWRRMAEAAGSGSQPAEFVSTHPSHETRIGNLEQWMPEAMQAYEENCR